jgi:hypothetical protein
MDVPADNNGFSHLHNIGLFIENFFGLDKEERGLFSRVLTLIAQGGANI